MPQLKVIQTQGLLFLSQFHFRIEEYDLRITKPFIEINFANRCIGFEIGEYVTNIQV